MVFARRVDANHAEIIQAFRNLGCTVFDTSRLGGGYPDATVQYGGMTLLVEIKTEKGKATKAQAESKLMAKWVRNMDDVEQAVRTLRKWAMAQQAVV